MKYKSKFEKLFAETLTNKRIKFKYEPDRIKYTSIRHYVPDFKIGKLYIETKGRFTSFDRAKHLLIKEQHPELDIRFVFMNPYNKLYKGSNTTYAEWCDKHGFKWAHAQLPKEWLSK